MVRVTASFVALLFLSVSHGAVIQDGQPRPTELNARVAASEDAACSLTISRLRREKTDDGWAPSQPSRSPLPSYRETAFGGCGGRYAPTPSVR